MLESLRIETLRNGLSAICLHKPGAPVVAVEVWYRAGSAAEPAGKRGVAHVLEHMMFRGSEHVGPEEHARRIAAVGGHSNAFTTEDATAYVNAVPRAHLDMVLEFEADRMYRLQVDPGLFAVEQKVVVEEYHTYMNNPVAKAMLEFRREFFGTHPYATGPLGDIDDIRNMDGEDCAAFHRTHYAPSNAAVVVVGEIGSEEQTVERVARWFDAGGDTASRPPPQPERTFVPPREGRSIERRVEFDVPVQVHGFAGPAAHHEDAVALDVLMRIVGQGESSRLTQALVQRSGVAVAAGGANQFLRAAGMSMLFALYTPDTAPRRVRELLAREVARVGRDGVSGEELDKARNQSLASHVFELYSAEHICRRLGLAHVVEGGCEKWRTYLARLERIGADDVVEAARRYWCAERAWVLTLRPRQVAASLVVAGLARRVLGIGRAREPVEEQ